MKPLSSLCIALLAALLCACGSSPQVRYYSLESAAVGAGDEPGARVVGLGPLRVPEYLRRSQMVTRGPGLEVEVHEFARWAEPVDKAMHRVLAANVDGRLDGVVVVAYPYLETVPVDFVVVGQVDRFDSDASGRVLLQVQWAVLDAHRNGVIPPQRARYEARAAEAGDSNAIVGAMNEALRQFSDDIAAQLRSALPEFSDGED